MAPFDTDLTPLALPGEAVRLAPSGDVYEVAAVEQLARIGAVDYGPADAQDRAEDNGKRIVSLEDELEMSSNSLGQIWVNPLSDVTVEIRQSGQQDQRFTNSNKVGKITPRTPANQRQVFVYEDDHPYAIIRNDHEYDMAKTLVYYTGFKMYLGSQPLSGGEIDRLGGSPATVPVGSLKRAYGG